jgi:hypothetical protein
MRLSVGHLGAQNHSGAELSQTSTNMGTSIVDVRCSGSSRCDPVEVGGDAPMGSLKSRRKHRDLGADHRALIEVDDILVDHADAAGGYAFLPIVHGSTVPWMR